MDARQKELKERLVASGTPYFSCSEMHELYDYITELENAVKTKKKKQKLNNNWQIEVILSIYPNLREEYERTGKISDESILKQAPQAFKNEKELDDLLNGDR